MTNTILSAISLMMVMMCSITGVNRDIINAAATPYNEKHPYISIYSKQLQKHIHSSQEKGLGK